MRWFKISAVTLEQEGSATGTTITTTSLAVHTSYTHDERWQERTDWFRARRSSPQPLLPESAPACWEPRASATAATKLMPRICASRSTVATAVISTFASTQ